jgi:hypothetical protein
MLVLVGLLLATCILLVAPAAGTPAQTPKRGGTVIYAKRFGEPACLASRETCDTAASTFVSGRILSRVLWNAEDWWLAR